MSKKEILNSKKKILEAQKRAKKSKDRIDIILSLDMEWDSDKVFKFNRLIEQATNSEIKLDYTENELKLMLLEYNRDLLIDNEYERYLEKLKNAQKNTQKKKI